MEPTITLKPTRGRMKSLLGYYGGKAGAVGEWIRQFVDAIPHKNYVEPYGGMAGVLMQKRPSRTEVYNDKADVLVNLFAVIRDPAGREQLREALTLTLFSRKHYKECAVGSTRPASPTWSGRGAPMLHWHKAATTRWKNRAGATPAPPTMAR